MGKLNALQLAGTLEGILLILHRSTPSAEHTRARRLLGLLLCKTSGTSSRVTAVSTGPAVALTREHVLLFLHISISAQLQGLPVPQQLVSGGSLLSCSTVGTPGSSQK